jgi:hypothetical protein
MVLTSNRVGTFDEAFRSRIQLSLRYDNLNLSQRRQIWSMFINRLARLDSVDNQEMPVDEAGILDHLEELSLVKLNGREIRNALSTARQLAAYKAQPLRYEHLKVVLLQLENFEKYLQEVHGGFTYDELARDSGTR